MFDFFCVQENYCLCKVSCSTGDGGNSEDSGFLSTTRIILLVGGVSVFAVILLLLFFVSNRYKALVELQKGRDSDQIPIGGYTTHYQRFSENQSTVNY